MTRAALSRTVLVVLASIAFIGAVLLVNWSIPRGGSADSDLGRGGPKPTAADVNPEAAEQGELAQERHEAYQRALEAGTFGKVTPITGTPAAGWFGETIVDATVDDWEPPSPPTRARTMSTS